MFSNFGASSTFGAFSGSSPQTNVFGQPAQQQPGSLFGGGFNQPKSTFGSTFGSPTATSTMFGNNRLSNPSSSMFGGSQTATVSPFSSTNPNQNQAGTSIPFNAITGTDTMMRNGVASPINTRHQCITCMKEYENKSLEELRLEDYQLNRKGQSQNAIFGATNPQQSTSIFSSINTNTGAANTFGQPNTSFGTPSTGSGLFSNINQPKQATSFFSNQTSTAPFGGGASVFSFSNPSSQPASIFPSNNNTNTAAGTLGNSFTFQQPQQPALTGSLFGPKTLPPATSTTTFGGFGTTTMAKTGGIFSGGTPAVASFGGGTTTQFGTGTGGMFGATQPQPAKPFSFGTPFTSQPAVTSAFGGTAAPAFNFNSTSTSAPSMSGFGTPAPTFGTAGAANTSGFGSFGTTPNFSLGNPTTNSGFGNTSFSFSNPTTGGLGFSSFNQSNTFAQPSQQFAAPATVPFATSPYKDSPLFYNLISTRSLEELKKPTNPMAQRAIKEAARRRHSTSFNSSASPNMKNFTYPVAKTQQFSKTAIFDGFEDEAYNAFDILTPKSTVKKLSLKSVKIYEKPRYGFPTFNRTTQPMTSSPSSDPSHPDLDASSLNNSFDESITNANRTNGDYSSMSKTADNINESFQSSGDNIHAHDSHENGDVMVPNPANGTNPSGHGCNIICTRPGYYVHPSIEDLDLQTDSMNNCLVRGLIVGRHNYGEIRFSDVVNVAGINIDEIVLFRHKEVVVYPDDEAKPPVGEGLNGPAEISIERVWPIQKSTKDPIKSPPRIRAMNYEKLLRRACIRLESEFVSYNDETGTWTFRVKHFSKYNCEVEENEEEDENVPPMKKLKGKGLGGIPSQHLGSGPGSSQQKLQGPESTLTNMLMHKTWSGGDSSFSIENDMPVFHTLMSSGAAVPGKTASSAHLRDDYDYIAEGDIEHNPLTPSESEDSEKEATKYDSGASAYESMLEACPTSPRAALMKSMFSLYPEEEENQFSIDFKISERSSRVKTDTDKYASTIDSESRQYFVRTDRESQRKPLSIDLYSPSSVRIPTSVHQMTSEPWLAPSQGTVTSSIPPYKSRVQTILLPVLPEKSLFKELKGDGVQGLKRGCGRVSFLRNGELLCITNNQVNWKGSDAVSGRVTIYGKECYDTMIPQSISRLYIETMNKQMNIELRVRIDETEYANVIPEHLNVLTEVSNAMDNIEPDDENTLYCAKFVQELQVWSLCNILWSDGEELEGDKSSFFTQRGKLSAWFIDNRHALFGWMDITQDTTILDLVKCGMHLEACQHAVLEGNYHIALLLSMRNDEAAMFCQRQLAAWTEIGALDLIPEDTKEIFRIFSGPRLPSRYGVAPMTNREWLQNFAIHLWYSCPATWSLTQVISSYLDIIRTQVDWCEETEEFREENQPSDTNLFISLLKLYASIDYPLKFILDSRRNNLGSLEYKLPFLLMRNLQPLGYISDKTLFENVVSGFAGQLNTMGLYDWAIFALQYLPDKANKVMIDKALQSYIKCDDHVDAEKFLTDKLNIAEEQIFSLKALHSSFTKRPDHELWYLLKCKQYKEAYDIFAKKLFTLSINCKKNESKVLHILDVLHEYEPEIPEWNQHGQLVRSYLTLQKIRDADGESKNSYGSDYIETNIKNFLTSFVEYKPLDDSESAFLLELALSAQKMVALLVMDNKLRQIEEDSEADIEENNLINLMKLPVPSEYMSSVQKFVATWMAV